MEVFIALLALFALALIFFRNAKPSNSPHAGESSAGRPRASGRGSSEQKTFDANISWLTERWTQALAKRTANEQQVVPDWFFDPVTERQVEYLRRLSVDLRGHALTKGQASDVIGLFHPIDDGDEDVLKFFKLSMADMNQTKGREAAAQLLNDPIRNQAWHARPATPIQREYYRFMSLPHPKELTYEQAETTMRKLNQDQEKRIEEWDAFESGWLDLSDADTRAEYDIKKPSLAKYRNAWDELRPESIVSENLPDLDAITEKLKTLYPGLNT